MRLSKYAKRLTGQPMFKLLSEIKAKEAAGEDIVHFEIGDPDFPSPRTVVNACIATLAAGEDQHYCDSQGLLELRQAIANYHSDRHGLEIDPLKPSNIVIAPGCNPLIYCIMQCLLEPGDGIFLERLSFPTYESIANLLGMTVLRPGFSYELFKEPKLSVINSPQNPSGLVYDRSDLAIILNTAKKMSSMVLSDEIYNLISYDGQAASMLDVDPTLEHTVIISGFSKAFSMTGWRLGYMIAPEWLAEKVTLMLQTIVSCTCPFTQRAALSIFKNWPDEVSRNLFELKTRRDFIVSRLSTIPKISCRTPQGAFYVLVDIRGTEKKSWQVCQDLLQHGVAALPGGDFGEAGEGFIRLSYCTSRERIIEGVDRIKEALK